MDKCKVFKIVQFSILFSFAAEKNIWAAEYDESSEVDEDDYEDNDEEELEPLKELPDVQPICPDLDRALDLATNKYKVKRANISDSVFKNLKFGIEVSSLSKDLWFLMAQRKSKNRDYNFDYHGRIETVWKHNFYFGGDVGCSSGKFCVWEGSDERIGGGNYLDTKYAHLSRGLYANAMVGYDYQFDENNDVVLAMKFGYAWATIEKLKDQTCSEGEKNEIQPYWIGLLIAFENKIFSSPIFWGGDLQINYLVNKKEINNLQSYFIPDYGHSDYKLNFNFNLFLGLKMNFEDQIIVP